MKNVIRIIFLFSALLSIYACAKKEQGAADISLAVPLVDLSISGSTITATWQPVPGAVTYQVEYKQTSEQYFKLLGETAKTECTLYDLLSDTSYDVRVKAKSKLSSSAWSNVATIVTEQIRLLPPVVRLAAEENQLTASWNQVTSALSYAVEYKLSSAEDWKQAGTTKTFSYSIAELDYETNYDVRVKALANGAESDYSAVQTEATGEMVTINGTKAMQIFIGMCSASLTREFKLSTDIDMSTVSNFKAATDFGGTLDGQGYSIKNLYSTEPLFKQNSGTIKNLNIASSCTFSVADAEFGAFATTNKGTITACTSEAIVQRMLNEATTVPQIIGGIVARNVGTLSSCTHNGSITVSSKGSIVGSIVAGVAAFSSSNLADCTNGGSVSLSAPFCSAKAPASTLDLYRNFSPAVGGVAGIMKDATVTACNNTGSVSLNYSAVENTPNVDSHLLGGVVAASSGNVSGCDNSGNVTATAVRSDARGKFDAQNANFHIGGVVGSESQSADQNVSDIISCTNSGNIRVDSDASKSNMAVGGIIGWPSKELSPTCKVYQCTNRGRITVEGFAKYRVGGIAGGTGNIDSCTMSGSIIANYAYSASSGGIYMGGIIGYHATGHTLTKCTVDNAKLEYSTAKNYGVTGVVYGMGGLIGNTQNTAGSHGCTSCRVKCQLISNHYRDMGFIVGRLGGSAAVSFGTTDEPVLISGGSSITIKGNSAKQSGDPFWLVTTTSLTENGTAYNKAFRTEYVDGLDRNFAWLFGTLNYNATSHTYSVVYSN